MATYHLKYPPWLEAVTWMRLQCVWCNVQPLQLVHWAVMKLVYEAQECTWMEVKLRASPRLHHEVCRGCAIVPDESYSRNDGKQRARWCKKGNKWAASAWFHVEDEIGREGGNVTESLWCLCRTRRLRGGAWFCRSLTPQSTDLLMRCTEKTQW